jgi:hypothetical protein
MRVEKITRAPLSERARGEDIRVAYLPERLITSST